MIDDELMSWTMLGYAVIATGVATILIAWPLEGERCGVVRMLRERLRR